MRLVLLTPNADPMLDLATELAVYANALRCQAAGIEIRHAIIDEGPVRIETEDDALAAAPIVLRKVRSLAQEGADAIVIDCMSEPGLAEAQLAVGIPVVGPRSAVIATANGEPVVFVRDEAEAKAAVDRGARVVSFCSTALGGRAAPLQAELGVQVLDPLLIAFREALRLAGRQS